MTSMLLPRSFNRDKLSPHTRIIPNTDSRRTCARPRHEVLSMLRNMSAFTGPAAPALRASSFRGQVCNRAPLRYVGPRMAFTSIGGVLTDAPVTLPCDKGLALGAIYKQVLGNAHVMESERAELRDAESTFLINNDVREFVRAIANSDTYRSRFFHGVSQYRFVELLFKHLLGRAPRDATEYQQVMAKYRFEGYEKCIDWFLDSDEYEDSFGAQTVPYGIYRGMYPTNEEFNRSVAMRGTPCSSDKGRSSMLQYAVLSGDSPSWLSVAKALPFGTERGTGLCVGGHWTSTQRNKNGKTRIGTKIPGGVVFYD